MNQENPNEIRKNQTETNENFQIPKNPNKIDLKKGNNKTEDTGKIKDLIPLKINQQQNKNFKNPEDETANKYLYIDNGIENEEEILSKNNKRNENLFDINNEKN